MSSGNWRKTCRSGDGQFAFDVDDGAITYLQNDTTPADRPVAYVDAAGEFRLIVPGGQREVSSRESGSVGKSTLRLIFDGTPEEAESAVRFTMGDSKYGGAGCWWRLDLERI